MILPELNNKPKQGFLKVRDQTWSFIPGQTRKKTPIILPDFAINAETL
jgi:hypothetical protein